MVPKSVRRPAGYTNRAFRGIGIATRRGDADALSGRDLSVEDDLNALVKQVAAEPSAEQRMLRLVGIAAISTEG